MVVATWARVRVAGMVAGMGMGRARVRVRVYLCGGREGLRRRRHSAARAEQRRGRVRAAATFGDCGACEDQAVGRGGVGDGAVGDGHLSSSYAVGVVGGMRGAGLRVGLVCP